MTVFALHLLAAVPNAGPYVEYSIEGLDYYPWQDGLFTPPLEVRDGLVRRARRVPAGASRSRRSGWPARSTGRPRPNLRMFSA